MSNRTIYTNISKLYSMEGGIRVGKALEECAIYEDAYMICEDDKIVEIGEMKDLQLHNEKIIDLEGKIVIPGLIDAHSHLVFGGDRVNEYTMKIKGASYMDIYHAGGGIHATVRATRKASFDELYDKAEKTVYEFLKCGVTTLEAKSGYGLNKEDELKQLRVVQKLNENTPMDLISTFMPAHALYKDYQSSQEY